MSFSDRRSYEVMNILVLSDEKIANADNNSYFLLCLTQLKLENNYSYTEIRVRVYLLLSWLLLLLWSRCELFDVHAIVIL